MTIIKELQVLSSQDQHSDNYKQDSLQKPLKYLKNHEWKKQ